MIHSSHSTASFASAACDANTLLEHGAREAGASTPPWSLTADEVEKMDRLERGETLALSAKTQDCLHRVINVPDRFSNGTIRRALRACGPSNRPSDEEVAAMVAEVPLCLLNAHQRLHAIALRQQRPSASVARGEDADDVAFRDELIVATMNALNAARGDTGNLFTKALVKITRWETDANSLSEAEARANGGRALRQVVWQQGGSLDLDGYHMTDGRVSEFSLPPRALIADLGLSQRRLVINLGRARPLDIGALHDSLSTIDPDSLWSLHIGPRTRESPALLPSSIKQVDLIGLPHRSLPFALELIRERPQRLEEVLLDGPMPERMPALPIGWGTDRTQYRWSLVRGAFGAAASAPPSQTEGPTPRP
jgi:hypothetical protein